MLKFKEHLSNILTKGSYKINTLSRITPYMSLSKKRIPMHSFFTSQICYCPLVWMFYIHKINNKINSLHKRRLKVIYNDKTSSFEELFEKDRSVSIHTQETCRSLQERCSKFSGTCHLLLFVKFLMDVR